MSSLKIRIKIAQDEFEAEGPPETVQAQVRLFARLLGREQNLDDKTEEQIAMPPSVSPPQAMSAIARVDGKVVSLRVEAESLPDAVLLLLLGQQELRGNTAVAGSEIMSGLRESGYAVNRADHILQRYASTGHIVVTGKRRLRRYRLTTDGVEKARKIAQTLAAAKPHSD
jgi:hypothetical protein